MRRSIVTAADTGSPTRLSAACTRPDLANKQCAIHNLRRARSGSTSAGLYRALPSCRTAIDLVGALIAVAEPYAGNSPA